MNWPAPSQLANVSDHQRSQYALATAGNVGCLTGGAGVGKTHLMAAIVELLPEGDYALAAPTGKAAVRMMESMISRGFEAHASTIHTLLAPQRPGYDGDGWSFDFNCHNPLPYEFFIIDESTMIPSGLMQNFLSAVPDGAKVLFIGDPGQLPPVGKGRPFADMMDAGLPHGHLSEPHRFAGRIGQVCDDIRNGRQWTPSEKLDLDAEFPENFRHIQRMDPASQVQALREVVRRVIDRGFDPIGDMQVLTAMNEKGPLSCKSLNTILQEILNPRGENMEGCPFRIGDKVMCAKNGWRTLSCPTSERPSMYVANGEIGRVVAFGNKGGVVAVDFPARDGIALFGKEEWREGLQLAFAVTVHKSQGSQWPVVCSMIDHTAQRITSRAFWYTAFSRAEHFAVSVGNKSVVNQDCRRVDIDRRVTLLKERIGKWQSERLRFDVGAESAGGTV